MNCAPHNITLPNSSKSMCRFNECLHCECDSDVFVLLTGHCFHTVTTLHSEVQTLRVLSIKYASARHI